MKLQVKINGENQEFETEPNVLLLDFLREKGYFGVKNGCAEGTCGSCVVLVDDIPKKSCLLFVGQVQNHNVLTIEGLGTPENPHPIQEEFVKHAAIQCGFCIPGMILSANALLLKNPNPTDDDIKAGLDGNICRCTGYTKQIQAVQDAAATLREEK